MQNSECRMNVFPAEMIEIVAGGDTIILHFAFFILHSITENVSIKKN